MNPQGRWLAPHLEHAFDRPYVHILFGARQTGKSTLLRTLLPQAALWLDLSRPAERSRYLADPDRLVGECLALPRTKAPATVVVDEAQTVPALFDAVQHLYDNDKGRFRFVLSGSSARKLRVTGANLLPGRAMLHRLYPLVLRERPASEAVHKAAGDPGKIVELAAPRTAGPGKKQRVGPHVFPAVSLLDRLTYGELPGIALAAPQDREALLRTYGEVYLEEELRREGLIKDWSIFSRFLRLAALESGNLTNFANIARDASTSPPTVKSHYQLLEDMFVGFAVPAFSGSKRKHVLSTPRFFFFDLGVRHAAAGLSVTAATVAADPGRVFEQWVGIELWKRLNYLGRGRLMYLRTKGGAELDFIVDTGDRLVPIEVKWTERPTLSDARHVTDFLDEQPRRAKHGFVVCRCARPQQLSDRVTALPWWQI